MFTRIKSAWNALLGNPSEEMTASAELLEKKDAEIKSLKEEKSSMSSINFTLMKEKEALEKSLSEKDARIAELEDKERNLQSKLQHQPLEDLGTDLTPYLHIFGRYVQCVAYDRDRPDYLDIEAITQEFNSCLTDLFAMDEERVNECDRLIHQNPDEFEPEHSVNLDRLHEMDQRVSEFFAAVAKNIPAPMKGLEWTDFVPEFYPH